MAINIYILLSVLYFILGIVSVSKIKYKNLALKLFIILTVLLPITKFTTDFHIRSQISMYYFFFIGVGLIYFIKLISINKINLKLIQGVLMLLFLLFYSLGHYFLFVQEEREIINVFKDIKPLIVIILAFLFIDYYKDRLQTILNKKFCDRLILFNFIVSSAFFYLMIKYELHLKLTDDPYYKYEELRYETLGTYFGLFYLVYLLLNSKKPSIKQLALIIIPLFYTGNRTLIFSFIIVISLFFLLKISIKKLIAFLSSAIIFCTGLFYFVYNSDESSPLFRIKKLLNLDYIEYALLNRYSPYIITIRSFNIEDFIFGKGLGYTFFIPWFVWREKIENYNIYIDNLYLTLYTKFGVLFIGLFFIIYFYLNSYIKPRIALFYFVFILIISITNAMAYQYNFLWLLIGFVLPFKAVSDCK